MNSLLRGLMASAGNTDRPLPSLILLGIVDFCCILIGLEQISVSKISSGAIWITVGIGSGLIGYYWSQIKRAIANVGTRFKKKPSKLVIHWANYQAIEGGGEEFQVGDFLRQIIAGDSLVFDIENHNFVIGDKNFVPRDPLWGKEKRLQVNYSYGAELARTTERREHGRLLLPEDSKIKWLQGEVDRLKAVQPKPSQYPLTGLRLKTLEVCVELKGFLGEHGAEPTQPAVHKEPGESNEDFLARFRARSEDDALPKWRAKFLGDFRIRFGTSVPQLRDEILRRAQISNSRLNGCIDTAIHDPNGNVQAVEGIIDRLWEMAKDINC
jgi:hypothetical protein